MLNFASNQRSAINVIEFYKIAVVLKQIIRSGWKQWNVKQERLESVAEHVYGTCMLAIAMASEFNYDIDIKKVVMMMAIHELEETVISDITPFDGIPEEEKMRMGHEAIVKILSPLASASTLINLIIEFDSRATPEARFAYQCDKLECDLMSIIYDRQESVTFKDATDKVTTSQKLNDMYESGEAKTMSDFFYLHDKEKYDNNFMAVLDEIYANKN
ncbi:MAG: HD domain-containing protein [Clostridia bacterium]|nr:HD domain-containing protein [Clostridia bacterium]